MQVNVEHTTVSKNANACVGKLFWRLKRDRILEIEYLLVQTWDQIICPVIGTVHCDTVGSLTGPDNFILLFK